jgi:hypothetical protein
VPRDAPSYLDAAGILRILAGYVSTALRASATILGVLRTRTEPDDPSDPVSVGDNDPRVNKINAGLYYPSFTDAIAAAENAASQSNSQTAVLSVTTEVAMDADCTIPSNVILDIESTGIIATGGYALTVLGEIRAGAQQIFRQWEFGTPPDISGARFTECWPEWYGNGGGGTSLQALIDARASVPTRVALMDDTVYDYNTLDLSSVVGMHFVGNGGVNSTAELRHTGSGSTTAMSFSSANGLVFEGVKLTYSSLTFTGALLKGGHDPAADPGFLNIQKCWLGGVNGAYKADSLIDLDLAIFSVIRENRFYGARIGVKGASTAYSNVVDVSDNVSNDVGWLVYNPCENWVCISNGTEPLEHNRPADSMLALEAGRLFGADGTINAYNFVAIGNWVGDVTATAGVYSLAHIHGAFGAIVHGNKMAGTINAGSGGALTCFEFSQCIGVSVVGNYAIGDNFVGASGGDSTDFFIAANQNSPCTNKTPVSLSGGYNITRQSAFSNADGRNYVNGHVEVLGSTPFNNDAGTNFGVKLAARSGSLPTVGKGAMFFSLEGVAGFNDGDAMLAPATDRGGDLYIRNQAGVNFRMGNAVIDSLVPMGYRAGAGGVVTQLTSKAAAVALSKSCGDITTHNASLASGATVSFTFTNTLIAATDSLQIEHISGGTRFAYNVQGVCGAGSATIYIKNNTAGALGEALVLRFSLKKGATT